MARFHLWRDLIFDEILSLARYPFNVVAFVCLFVFCKRKMKIFFPFFINVKKKKYIPPYPGELFQMTPPFFTPWHFWWWINWTHHPRNFFEKKKKKENMQWKNVFNFFFFFFFNTNVCWYFFLDFFLIKNIN